MKIGKRIMSIFLTIIIALLVFGSSSISLKNMNAVNSSNVRAGMAIQFGTYNGKPIDWVCLAVAGDRALIISKDILCNKAFDAAGESNEYHRDGWGWIRKNYGSNCWSDSSLRQWLNTRGEVNYTHCPPGYADEDGFLTSFTDEELSWICSTTRKIFVNSYEKKRKDQNGKEYVEGGTVASKDAVKISDYSELAGDYWYQNVSDYMFLLERYELLPAFLYSPQIILSGEYYWTGIANNRNDCSFENVVTVGKTETLGHKEAAYSCGVRPACYIDLKATGDLFYKEAFLDGFEYSNDIWSFTNYDVARDNRLLLSDYELMFEEKRARTLLEEDDGSGGECYGMASTVAAFYNGSMHPEEYNQSFVKEIGLFDCNENDDYLNTAGSVIKMAHIFQYKNARRNNYSLNEILYEIKNNINKNNAIPVTVANSTGSHAILPYGYKEDPANERVLVYVYDCNSSVINDPMAYAMNFTFKNNNVERWSYYGNYGGTDVTSESGEPTLRMDTEASSFYSLSWLAENANENHLLIKSKGDLETDKQLSPVQSTTADNINGKQRLYFSEETTRDITFYNSSLNKSVLVVDGDSGIEFSANAQSVFVKVDDNGTNTIQIDAKKDELISTTFSDVDEQGELFDIKIEGTTKDNPTVTETQDGLQVTGLNEMTISYIQDENVISTKEVPVEDGRRIVASINNESNQIDVIHEHNYVGDTINDSCEESFSRTYTCSICGDSYDKVISALGHVDENKDGVCDRCKEPMPPTHTPGDINGDGALNNKDLNRLMKKLAGENVQCVDAALDVNGDGVVNNKDLNRLMKKLAGENVEIH